MTTPVMREDIHGNLVALTPEEDAARAALAPVVVPDACSKLGLKRAFDEQGQWTTIRAFIAADPVRAEDWALCTEVRVTDPLVAAAVAHFNMTETQVNALILRANELTA